MAGAPVGNRNAAKSKDWANALRWVAENYECESRNITKGQALREIAKTCFEQALAGDKDARAEIGNRLDGKAPQPVVGGDEDDNPIQHSHTVEWFSGQAAAPK